MLKNTIINWMRGYTKTEPPAGSAAARSDAANVRRIFGVYPAAFTREAAAGVMGISGGSTEKQEEKQEEVERLAVLSSWALADMRLIASRLASMQWLAERKTFGLRDGTKDVKEHDALALLRQPHPFWAGAQVWEEMAFWYLLRGNAYMFIATPAPGYGRPRELWPIPANKIRPVPQSIHDGRGLFAGTLVVDYEVNVGGTVQLVPGENVLHWRTANPFDNWLGLSPLNGISVALDVDYQQGRWLESFFGEDNAVPANIVSVSPDLGDIEFDETARRLREEFAGKRRTAIIRAGEIAVQVISQTLHEMEMTQGRAFTREQIDRLYMVPPEIFGGGGGVQAEIVFGRNVLQPLARGLVGLLNQWYMPYFGDADLRLKVPEMIPADRAMNVQEFATYSKARTVNEAREVLGLPPVKHPLADIPGEILTYEGQAYVISGGGGGGMMPPTGGTGPQDMPGGIAGAPDAGLFGINGGTPAGPQGGEKPPAGPTGPEGPNIGQGAMMGVFDIGDSSGQVSPKHSYVNEMEAAAGKSAGVAVAGRLSAGGAGVPRGMIEAQKIATDTELKRWKRVAKRALRAGEWPAGRAFSSSVLPSWLIDFIYMRLASAKTGEDIDAIFDEARVMLDDPRWRARQLQAISRLSGQEAHGPLKSLTANWRIMDALSDEDSIKAQAHVRGYWRTDPRTGRKVFVREYDRRYQRGQQRPGSHRQTKQQQTLPGLKERQKDPEKASQQGRGEAATPAGEFGPVETKWGTIPAWAIPKLGGTPEAAKRAMNRLMAMKVGKARASEPKLTATLQNIVNSTGGELHDLEYRLKSPKSIWRKFFSDYLPDAASPEDAMNGITDAVRYTIVFDNDTFVDNVIKTQDVLKSYGYEKYDHKWKNYFGYGGTYAGYNTVYRNVKTGELIEIQFHTRETIATKPISHKMYEQARTLPPGPERTRLESQMRDMWQNIPRPPGWERLPGTTFGSHTKSLPSYLRPDERSPQSPLAYDWPNATRMGAPNAAGAEEPTGAGAPRGGATLTPPPPVGGGVLDGGAAPGPRGGSPTNLARIPEDVFASMLAQRHSEEVRDGIRRGSLFWSHGDDAKEWSAALDDVEDELLDWIQEGGKS